MEQEELGCASEEHRVRVSELTTVSERVESLNLTKDIYWALVEKNRRGGVDVLNKKLMP